MLEILPMTEEHIEAVLQVEQSCFTLPWTKEDFEREMKENKLAIYRIAILDHKVVGRNYPHCRATRNDRDYFRSTN